MAAARDAWLWSKRHVEEQCQFAKQWAQFIEQSGSQLAGRLPSFANVLAGSITRWQGDVRLQEAVAGPVDLLIVEDADALTEADVLKLTRHARRCVLVGKSATETAGDKAPPAPLLAANSWSKLWRALGGDVARGPCSWQRDQGRLICQLMPLGVEDGQHLESERLADAADIELRILHRPRTRPCLAQVIFPPGRAFADAFPFMMREVQEFPLEPLGRTGWWSEDDQAWRWRLGSTTPVEAWIQLDEGVRLGAVDCDTTRVSLIEFDKSAGFDRAKAEAWLHRHRRTHDHERTAFLQTPYRFQPALSNLVQAIVHVGDWLTPVRPIAPNQAAGFEFVAAPALCKADWPRDGAGLELDLSASRHADRLPTGLKHGLPPRGFVNYLEAQALIRRLETWLQKEAADSTARVAVLGLYEGQVMLLRRLIEQSEILRSRPFPLEVALPSRMHQRECDLVFLSLTRSHAHRCVAFGDDPCELPLGLTRARSRLLVFGDLGTLCKRAQWQGPLEHLDAHTSHQERLLVSRLLACLERESAAPAAVNGMHVKQVE